MDGQVRVKPLITTGSLKSKKKALETAYSWCLNNTTRDDDDDDDDDRHWVDHHLSYLSSIMLNPFCSVLFFFMFFFTS